MEGKGKRSDESHLKIAEFGLETQEMYLPAYSTLTLVTKKNASRFSACSVL